MKNSKTYVSVGVPVYNGERYLSLALDSILGQTFYDFELVISDNASTDGTRAICESYAARDSRVRYYRNKSNIGAMPNFNQAFQLSSGKYFKWAAHDDILEPSFLEKTVSVLDKDPSVVLCHSWAKVIDEDGNICDNYPYNGKFKIESPRASERFRELIDPQHWCIHDFGLIRSSEIKKTPLYGSFTASDRVFLTRIGLSGRFHQIPEYLFLYRQHQQQSMKMVNRGPSLLLYAAWNDPANTNRITLPILKLYSEYFKAVREVPLSPQDRLQCYYHLLAWLVHNRQAQKIAKDFIIAAALLYARQHAKRKQLANLRTG